MTHATVHYMDAYTFTVEFPYRPSLKEAIASMSGANWNKASKRWHVPIARLGDVVKLFYPNVTLDYAVLVVRDEQMQRVLRQYMNCGVRFSVVGGKVACDHEVLNNWFMQNSSSLWVAALTNAKRESSNDIPKLPTGLDARHDRVRVEGVARDSANPPR